jgi:hypothetical protein
VALLRSAWDFLLNLGADLVGHATWGAVKGTVKEASGDALRSGVERQKKVRESRSELMAFIVSLRCEPGGEAKVKKLLRRLDDRQQCRAKSYSPYDRYVHGDENKMMSLLVDLYRGLGEPKEAHLRRQAFLFVADLSDREFDNAMAALNHDWIIQLVKRGATEIRAFCEKAVPVLKSLDRTIALPLARANASFRRRERGL